MSKRQKCQHHQRATQNCPCQASGYSIGHIVEIEIGGKYIKMFSTNGTEDNMFVSVRVEIGTKKLQFLKEEYPLLFTDLELVESLFKNCNLCKHSSSGFASKTCFQKRNQSTM